ncbi:siderophore ABC transporter substrate-binding protein [Arthrobacter sp. NamB2]|uniref:siderophore ABC transporter substrate-binding protein n=1 Tax=Arthrobacter sp. NamB2 TaxID=2576035 RepID=UPI0010C94851|nr:siderophore ABC transporter substrate-binding protein [Arthrobacter sp. NamB2]TKV29573.1 siderophore ABC transporter substrate-binding protein [Arthrobacter sp. NamB2]
MAHVRLAVLSAAAAATLALTACGGSSEAADEPAAASTVVEVAHAQGTTEVPVDPETVFTFDLGALDTLDALGVEVAGVPQGTLPAQLSDYEGGDITNIGSMKEPDFEAIAAAAPDLIIISGRVADSYDELSEIAPTIDLSVDAADPIASFTEHTESLGRIFGAEDAVAERLAALDTKISETKEAAASAGNGLILLTSAGEVTAYGAGSRFGLIHDVLGVAPAADVKAEGTHGEAVSFEYVAEINPAHLFVIDRDAAVGEAGAAGSAVLDNELVNGTDAAKNDAITYLDSASWYLIGYGLNNLDAMVSAVNEAVTA